MIADRTNKADFIQYLQFLGNKKGGKKIAFLIASSYLIAYYFSSELIQFDMHLLLDINGLVILNQN